MRRYMIERTDGQTDDILADYYRSLDGVIYFMRNKKEIVAYVPSNIVRIFNIGEVKEGEESEEFEEPVRRKNNNEDLISRSGLLNYLKTHWSSNVVEVIQTFEKAEYLD